MVFRLFGHAFYKQSLGKSAGNWSIPPRQVVQMWCDCYDHDGVDSLWEVNSGG